MRALQRLRGASREDEASRLHYRGELKAMTDALYNAPSVAVWVPFNEGWGQFDAAVYTQTTDVEREVNGYLTYDREVVKMNVARIRPLHEKLTGILRGESPKTPLGAVGE